MSADGKRYSGCHESAYRWSCADRECKATSPRRCSKARSSLPRREVTRWSILPNCGNSEIKRPYPFHPYSPMLQCMLRQTPHTPAHHARTHTHHARTHARSRTRVRLCVPVRTLTDLVSHTRWHTPGCKFQATTASPSFSTRNVVRSKNCSFSFLVVLL